MKEIRDIKIDLVMGNKNPIIERFMEITKDLKIINCDVYNEDGLEFIYHNKDGEWIFYQDAKKGVFWCCRERYWTLFSDELSLKYNEIRTITKYLVEETLKREISAPYEVDSLINKKVEEAIKRELATPNWHAITSSIDVEEALKREMATCPMVGYGANQEIEKTIKRETDYKDKANND